MKNLSRTLSGVSAFCVLALAGCNAAPDVDANSFSDVDFRQLGDSSEEIKGDLLSLINNSEETIDIALERMVDTDISDALIAAKDRGVTVRVVSDKEFEMDAGFVALADDGIPVVFGDTELKYLPEPTLTSLMESCLETPYYRQCTQREQGSDQPDDGLMVRPENYNQMSSNFAVVDSLKVWVSSSALTAGSSLFIGWTAHSQDLSIAFTGEFQQMFGGVFSDNLDTFNGPNKSTVHGIVYDSRIPAARPGRYLKLQPGYLTNQGIIKVEFNPQQRLTKELIDEIYRARGSVFITTDELLNDFVISALEYKHNAGFDVRVVVRAGGRLPNALVDAGVVREADAAIEYVPTMVVTDHEADRNGEYWGRTALVLSHSLYKPSPFEVFTPQQIGDLNEDDNVVRIYKSDMFIDGTMWTLREFGGAGRAGAGGDGVADTPVEQAEKMALDFIELWDSATPASGGN